MNSAGNLTYGQEMLEKYQVYRKVVKKAIEEGKVYRIIGSYDWPRLRIELRRRGWVEKMHFSSNSELVHFPQTILLEEAQHGNEYERVLMSKMLGGTEPDFIWMSNGKYYSRHLTTPILNKIFVRFCNFGGKDGLQKYFESIDDTANHPRSYNVISGMNLEQFEEDFLLTAAISVIRFLDNHQYLGDKFQKSENTVKWASMLRLFNYVQFHIENHPYGMKVCHENVRNSGLVLDHTNFILAVYDSIYRNQINIELYHRNAQDHIPVIRCLAQRIKDTWPKRQHDGYENIWLLKPAYSGQGNGIILSSDVKEITRIVKEYREQYVVQKYIERPLLVYETKFDIRQYFLITIHQNKIRGWAHSKCTVRLASEQFTFSDLSRAAHITNTAVQRRIKKKSSENLPDCHMWRITDMVEFFWKTGKKHAWNEIIFPSIKSTLKSFMKSCVHNIELRPGRFEIFGCDWLITEDLQTYLLEINRSPSLYYYTPVSVDVISNVMNDLIKVTVDYMRDETASTGGFELIYELDFDELPFEPFAMDWATYNINRFRRASQQSEPDVKFSLETLIDENIPQHRATPPRHPPPPPPPPPATQDTVTVNKDVIPPSSSPNPVVTVTTIAETHKTVLMETTKANVIACSGQQLMLLPGEMTEKGLFEKTVQNGKNYVENENPESSKYIIPPVSKIIQQQAVISVSDSICNGYDEEGIVLCDQNVPLPPPEVLMGQDFDPYEESLITY